jgi:hypothetical protein
MLSAFELERQARIEENKRRMSEMGINTLASKLDAVAAPVPNPQVRLPNNAHCPVFAPFSETHPREDGPRASRERARVSRAALE